MNEYSVGPLSPEAQARLDKYGSTLDAQNVQHVIDRIADYPEIVAAARALPADDAGVAPEQAAVAAVLADVLAAHPGWTQEVDESRTDMEEGRWVYWRFRCSGRTCLAPLQAGMGAGNAHRAHVAAALAANLPADDGAAYERGHIDGHAKGLLDPGSAWMNNRAAIKAEALREAADVAAAGYYRNDQTRASQVIAWLRRRADRIARADNLAADQHADEAGL